MEASLIRFIVLGKIPGTNLVLTFWVIIGVLTFLIAALLLFMKSQAAFGIVSLVNPLYNRRGLSVSVNLISA